MQSRAPYLSLFGNWTKIQVPILSMTSWHCLQWTHYSIPSKFLTLFHTHYSHLYLSTFAYVVSLLSLGEYWIIIQSSRGLSSIKPYLTVQVVHFSFFGSHGTLSKPLPGHWEFCSIAAYGCACSYDLLKGRKGGLFVLLFRVPIPVFLNWQQVYLTSRGHLAMSRDIFNCPDLVGGRDLVHVVVEIKNPAKYPIMHRTATPTPHQIKKKLFIPQYP